MKKKDKWKNEKALDIEWDASEPVHKYLKTLQDIRHYLDTLEADPGTPKMIRKVIYAMEKHAELDKMVCDWHKKTTAQQKLL